MPGTKIKGKSAANVTETNSPSALLKIESVVPTLSNRSHKFIRRSHSTLSPSYFKHRQTGVTHLVPNNLEENIEESYNNSVIFQNGNCKIKRNAKEKDKLPDRINLDKSGLISFPFIENEPKLRLLSLQHNLINVFQIPVETESTLNHEQNIQEKSIIKPVAPKQTQLLNQKSSSRNLLSATDNRIPLGTNITNLTTLGHKSGNQFTSQFGQKSIILNVNQKNLLKKSNSFIQSYFPHGTNGIRTKTVIQDKSTKNKLLHMTSFSTDPKSPNTNNKIQNISYSVQAPHTMSGFSLSLQNLVFLDLYDNQIDKVSNLDGLKSLTVLLLGKNRIVDITGIVSLKNTLRVLDLHGNKIANISHKICQLQELKSLNLAGNSLRQINVGDFAGMFSLKELNLKRNRIKKINGFDDLRNLERLWLCHNDLQKVEDMSCVAKAVNLKEVTIENNPVTLAGDCVSFLVSYLPTLTLLSQMQVTEQVRRAAMAWRKNKEISDTNYLHLSSDVCQNIRREEVISNARTSWELLRSQQVCKNSKGTQEKFIQQSDTLSLLSETTITQKCVVRQKSTLNNTIKDDKKLIRSSSQDNSSSITENQGDEYFRLPPILTPFLDHNISPDNTNSSNSSLGPNIDSSSSYCSSDNEDQNINKVKTEIIEAQKENGPNVECAGNTPKNENYVSDPIFKEPILVPENQAQIETLIEIQVDKITSIPAKTSSESSVNTNTDETRSQKIKSANPNRKYFSGSLVRAQTAKSSCLNNGSSTILSNPTVSNNIPKLHKNTIEREREQGGDYLIEICGRYLNVYGLGALKFIDKQWNIQKANDVHTVKFSYINFNSIASVLYRIKVRFPNAENFLFQETNITCFGQLNAIAEVQGICSLIIEPEGNPICTKDWRNYAIYRLSHWGLKQINGTEITQEETEMAEKMYTGLSDLVVWSLPESLLQPLLARLRLEESCLASKMTAKEWLLNADSSLKCVVGKEALQWKKTNTLQDDINARQKGCNQLTVMMENTCNAVEKLQKLETLWPNMLIETIRNTLLDYSQLDVYVKNLMTDILN